MRSRLARLSGAALVVVALAATACGTDSTSGTGPTSTAAPVADEASGHPVTIEHAFGTTSVEARPETIVSLSVQWTDALLALGETPTAYVIDSAAGETQLYPWHADQLGDTEIIEMAGEIPFEQLAALDPDLILVSHAADDPALFERLEQIAPTIGKLGERQVDRWQDQVGVLGQVLDDVDGARQVVADVAAQVEAIGEELPSLEGLTYTLVNYLPGDSMWVVADPNDGASELFGALGMHLPEALVDAGKGTAGRVNLSFEQVGLLESDLLAILPNGGEPAEMPGYDALTSVSTGAVAEMSFVDIVGINTPTPLSVPHVLDVLRPALEAAAAA